MIKEVAVEMIREVPYTDREIVTEVRVEVPIDIVREVDKEVPVQLIKEVPVEVVRESGASLPCTHVDSFDTKTYMMSEEERSARASGGGHDNAAPSKKGSGTTTSARGTSGGHGNAVGSAENWDKQVTTDARDAVLRRKGGWSGTNAYISTGSSREGSARPGTAPIAGRKGGGMDRGQPQQISATKPGFVSGRAVWGGTAERRANEAISKARSATNIN